MVRVPLRRILPAQVLLCVEDPLACLSVSLLDRRPTKVHSFETQGFEEFLVSLAFSIFSMWARREVYSNTVAHVHDRLTAYMNPFITVSAAHIPYQKRAGFTELITGLFWSVR